MTKDSHPHQGAAAGGDDQSKDGAQDATPGSAGVGVGVVQPDEQRGDEDEQHAGDGQEQSTGEGGEESGVIDSDAPYGRFGNGNPRKAPTGGSAAASERAKQRARLKSVTQSTFKPKNKISGGPTLTPLAVVNYQAMGEAATSMFVGVGCLAFGDDWKPEDQGEKVALDGSFRDYFRAMNMRDLPPGFALAFVISIYTLKRATKPTMKTRLVSIGGWFKDAASRMRRRGAP